MRHIQVHYLYKTLYRNFTSVQGSAASGFQPHISTKEQKTTFSGLAWLFGSFLLPWWFPKFSHWHWFLWSFVFVNNLLRLWYCVVLVVTVVVGTLLSKLESDPLGLVHATFQLRYRLGFFYAVARKVNWGWCDSNLISQRQTGQKQSWFLF